MPLIFTAIFKKEEDYEKYSTTFFYNQYGRMRNDSNLFI